MGTWTRQELKYRAKQSLRTSYWKGFLVSLLLAFITGGLPSCSSQVSGGSRGSSIRTEIGGMDDGIWGMILLIGIVVAIVVGLFMLAFHIFVTSPFTVGVRKYFIRSAEGDANMNELGFGFGKGRYMAAVVSMLWAKLLNFLWFLLLVIPGIVKAYAYSMVPYLLADNPTIGRKRAVELSNRMTRGHKLRIFVLDLSFIGWYLLGTLACVVGVLFVMPYYNAVKAELYLAIRREALEEGLCSPEELNLVNV
ncbi:DUF975 family protein [Paenibacillus koleovorans]|uniref:DUF975 family protein n=1 Tax=Paenibacillus koleovorans TaxID=121608 RepID=UPI000FD88378|nr:DUF975 family protein [Paenibacillus koleovorans]